MNVLLHWQSLLQFFEAPALQHPEFNVDENLMPEYQRQQTEALQHQIPDDDEEI